MTTLREPWASRIGASPGSVCVVARRTDRATGARLLT
jgi:hypothetical protein